MKRTERDQRDQEKITQGAGAAGPENAKENADGERPRSWRKYIEETEAADNPHQAVTFFTDTERTVSFLHVIAQVDGTGEHK